MTSSSLTNGSPLKPPSLDKVTSASIPKSIDRTSMNGNGHHRNQEGKKSKKKKSNGVSSAAAGVAAENGGKPKVNAATTTTTTTEPPALITTPSTTVATSSPAAGTIKKKQQQQQHRKRKYASAFRIKTKCLVALRYRSEGNFIHDAEGQAIIIPQTADASSTMVETWVDPTPGVDVGYMLLGRRIRCQYPKSVLQSPSSSDEGEGTKKKKISRIVDGEIVGLCCCCEQQGEEEDYISVDLLIDKSAMQPFLVRVDEEVDVSKLSDKDRKRHQYEEIIKGGAGKAIVRVHLIAATAGVVGVDKKKKGNDNNKNDGADKGRNDEPSNKKGDDKGSKGDNNMGRNDDEPSTISNKGNDDEPLICKWVMRKRVGATNLRSTALGDEGGTTTTTKTVSKQYVGNKHDSDAVQEQNWRWLARTKASHPDNNTRIASKFVLGQVMNVSPKTDGSTLAMVTVQEVGVSQHALRAGHQATTSDLFELKNPAPRKFQVPIEQLVIASRKVVRGATDDSTPEGAALIHHEYSSEKHSWKQLTKEELKSSSNDGSPDPNDDVLVCHRCGVEGSEMLKDHIACTPTAISCSKCLGEAKMFGKSGTFLKSCRCLQCRQHHAAALQKVFEGSHANAKKASGNSESKQQKTMSQECNVCCLRCKTGFSCKDCGIMIHKRCIKWMRHVDLNEENQTRCRACRAPPTQDAASNDAFSSARLTVKAMRFCDFDLPESYSKLHTEYMSSDKPITAMKPRGATPRKKPANRTPQKRKPTTTKNGVESAKKKPKLSHANSPNGGDEERAVKKKKKKFKSRCSRLLPYDPIQRRFEGISKHQIAKVSSRLSSRSNKNVIRNLRGATKKREEKKTASRAARANQRRMMKDVTAFGAASMSLDALAGRESHLRFDRSGIHAWGVFADQEIREGELIVEYRGVIIGNAVAEKREKEYEQAKIGSDYMFRIDVNSVCDATKQGNVARFINASCDPNCYTQIISINGVKRIVIYAKKDIAAGQELCYDYKFPLEYHEEKRIPCYCGSKDCRGFMNWDKKYVALPLPAPSLRRQSSSSFKTAAVEEVTSAGAAAIPAKLP